MNEHLHAFYAKLAAKYSPRTHTRPSVVPATPQYRTVVCRRNGTVTRISFKIKETN